MCLNLHMFTRRRCCSATRPMQFAARFQLVSSSFVARFQLSSKLSCFCVNRFYPKTQLSWLARLGHSHCNSADPLTDGLKVCCVFYRPEPGVLCVLCGGERFRKKGATGEYADYMYRVTKSIAVFGAPQPPRAPCARPGVDPPACFSRTSALSRPISRCRSSPFEKRSSISMCALAHASIGRNISYP